MSKEMTDQQKLDAINILLCQYGEDGLAKHFKEFLFRVQGSFLVKGIDYPPEEGYNNLYMLHEFFNALELEPKEESV